MRILQVTPTYPPAWSYGGITREVYEITRELSKRGHDVEVWTSDALNLHSRVKDVDVKLRTKVRYFKNLSFTLTRALNIHITPGMVISGRELRNFDIVHFHGARIFQTFAIYPQAKKFSVPYVLQAHGSLPRIMAKQGVKWVYDLLFGYKLLRDASKVIALNRIEVQQYMDMGVPEEKIEVIPNGIDLSEYVDMPPKGSFKKKFSIENNEKIILYLGRIHESKGLDLLAEAFSIASKEIENATLVVMGPDDGYATTFSKLISNLGIEDKVLLTGFVERRDKLAALVDSHVLVTPRFYGFPVTFLEACLAGCPIVTTSNALDWVHNNVGYVVKNSPIALAKAISNILEDDRKKEKFVSNCISTLKNFDISAITTRLEEMYKSIVNQ
jgi:glycosyltransferase involved in cell wall biosynthesis